MTDLSRLPLRLDYASAAADLIDEFYIPCLNNSVTYDRAVAYFRSSVFCLIGVAISDFALRGGRMRLVCSPSFATEDHDVLASHENAEREIGVYIKQEIENLLSNPLGASVVALFGTLLQSGALHVKVAYRPHSPGIFHMKLGLFEDDHGNCVSFIGSENETAMAWDRELNFEAFDAFTSWEGEKREQRRIQAHKKYFADLWDNCIPDLRVVSLPDVPKSILEQHANINGISAAVEGVRQSYKRVSIPNINLGDRRKPQAHQLDVITNWWKTKRGIIDHVTGAGKTFSALWIIRKWLSVNGASCIVLVPSDILADQWEKEIREEMGDVTPRILRIGGSNATPDGTTKIAFFTNPRNDAVTIIVATMQSACRPAFIQKVYANPQLLLVADEVHKVGSTENRKVMQIEAGGRLGLSATPERFFDYEGSIAIKNYFGDKLEPTFGIGDAQAAGRLVPYDYIVHTVALTDDESKDYNSLTRRIIVQRSNNKKAQGAANSVERLLQLRAKILKKAANKIDVATDVMKRYFKRDAKQRWLVYCDDTDQLDLLKVLLRKQGIESQTYTSQMRSAKKETIAFFEKYGGVMLSIHCLDEGVDIPIISHALILASSVNPREHLQRRGRVLRKAPGKYSAAIHDVLVGMIDKGTFKIFRSEARRAEAFAEDSRSEAVKVSLKDLIDMSVDDGGVDFESAASVDEVA